MGKYIGIAIIIASIFFTATPVGRETWNLWFFGVQKADDATRYETRQKVEDSCRAMMASYTSDKLIYEQYKDNSSSEKQGWAEQAKMRANKTAASYNEYVSKNSNIWANNIPPDIRRALSYIN